MPKLRFLESRLSLAAIPGRTVTHRVVDFPKTTP